MISGKNKGITEISIEKLVELIDRYMDHREIYIITCSMDKRVKHSIEEKLLNHRNIKLLRVNDPFIVLKELEPVNTAIFIVCRHRYIDRWEYYELLSSLSRRNKIYIVETN